MSRWEVTNERPTEYSTWHRTLPNSCPYTDIDLVEVRKGKIVAIIETKRGLYKRNLKDLQDVVTEIRLVPLSLIFNNFWFKHINNL